MKAVHINKTLKKPTESFPDLLAIAREQEMSGDLEDATQTYLQCLKLRASSETCYNRLMILYRKQKLYKKEAGIIKSGIKAFENLYQNKSPGNKKIAALSKSILRSTGLIDTRGKSVFDLQPVKRWKQRLQLLTKRFSF